ncbi:hypothetical protein [Hydrogenophaga flava]|uniref:hypothetical protein n=1 Tax=Hydrogenophaga flava TaxID=65657 RepID=UPI00082545CB|nr:hypothetical protein [Hydrogenophaga flava]
MSQLLIHEYLGQLDLIKKVSGHQRETIVRGAFKDLLKAWGCQRKEKKRKAPPIREEFDTYRLAGHKGKVVDLLQDVTTVSMQTMQVTEAMKGVAR